MAETFHLIGYGIDGRRVIDTVGSFDETPEFYAFQMLHADGVVCAEVIVADGEQPSGSRSVLRQCDPGVRFEGVVTR